MSRHFALQQRVQSLSLRFEKMPERHAELAWRFGEPDEIHEDEGGLGDEGDPGETWWVLHSPLSLEAEISEHLRWAADCLRPHEAFVGELIALGGRVILRMRSKGSEGALLRWNARLLLPMAHTGVQIEFEVGAGEASEQ